MQQVNPSLSDERKLDVCVVGLWSVAQCSHAFSVIFGSFARTFGCGERGVVCLRRIKNICDNLQNIFMIRMISLRFLFRCAFFSFFCVGHNRLYDEERAWNGEKYRDAYTHESDFVRRNSLLQLDVGKKESLCQQPQLENVPWNDTYLTFFELAI